MFLNKSTTLAEMSGAYSRIMVRMKIASLNFMYLLMKEVSVFIGNLCIVIPLPGVDVHPFMQHSAYSLHLAFC